MLLVLTAGLYLYIVVGTLVTTLARSLAIPVYCCWYSQPDYTCILLLVLTARAIPVFIIAVGTHSRTIPVYCCWYSQPGYTCILLLELTAGLYLYIAVGTLVTTLSRHLAIPVYCCWYSQPDYTFVLLFVPCGYSARHLAIPVYCCWYSQPDYICILLFCTLVATKQDAWRTGARFVCWLVA